MTFRVSRRENQFPGTKSLTGEFCKHLSRVSTTVVKKRYILGYYGTYDVLGVSAKTAPLHIIYIALDFIEVVDYLLFIKAKSSQKAHPVYRIIHGYKNVYVIFRKNRSPEARNFQ